MDIIVIFYCRRWSACWPVWFIMKVQVLPIYECLTQNSKLEAVCIPGLEDSIILTTWRELTLLGHTIRNETIACPQGVHCHWGVLKPYLILDAIAYMTSIVLIIIDQVDKNDVQTEQIK